MVEDGRAEEERRPDPTVVLVRVVKAVDEHLWKSERLRDSRK